MSNIFSYHKTVTSRIYLATRSSSFFLFSHPRERTPLLFKVDKVLCVCWAGKQRDVLWSLEEEDTVDNLQARTQLIDSFSPSLNPPHVVVPAQQSLTVILYIT